MSPAPSLPRHPRLIVGERINAQGSRRAKRLLLAGEYDGLVALAREQLDAGAHVLDVCVALDERSDEAEQMAAVVGLLGRRVDVPLMLDSTDLAVVARALEHVPGRGIINSVSLDRGRARIDAGARLARQHGAALVALCIDEAGLAVTCARKLDVARRIHDLVGEHGLPADALVLDPLTFTLATGKAEWLDSARETLDAVREIKRAFPGVQTLLGVSNVSFGLPREARTVLNSVFLHHAVEAGLDAAIVNPAGVRPYAEIPALERELADDLVFNRRADALARFVAAFEAGAEGTARAAADAAASLASEPRTRQMDGERL